MLWFSTNPGKVVTSKSVTEQDGGGVVHDNDRKDPPFLSLEVPPPHTHLLGSKCPPPEEKMSFNARDW